MSAAQNGLVPVHIVVWRIFFTFWTLFLVFNKLRLSSIAHYQCLQCSVWQLFWCCEQKIFHALPDMAKCQTLLRLAKYLQKVPKSRRNVLRITIICWERSGGETTPQFSGHFIKTFFPFLVSSYALSFYVTKTVLVGPKWFWSDQIDLDLTIIIWSRPKWIGHDQNELVGSKCDSFW